MIQVGAYRNGITPLPGILMIPYELNRYYLFAFSDVGQYNGSLFFSSREAAAKFIEDNGLSEIFCQVFPALFPFSDVIAYTDPVRIYAHDQRSVPVDTVVHYNYNNDTSTIDNFSNMYTSSITYHKVQKGETLYSISKKYNVTVQSLQNLNNIGDTNIAVDRVIRIN
jgi:LysM repeat protein